MSPTADCSTHAEVVACHDCDLLQRIPPLRDGARAVCPRCGATLRQSRRDSTERSLALVVTGLLLFVVANLFPFLTLNARGQVQDSNLISGSIALWEDGQIPLALLVLLTTWVFPLFDLVGTLYLLTAHRLGRQPAGAARLFRFLQSAQPWGMLEVFMLGVLVSVVKLGDIATIVPGVAMYAFAGLVVTLAAMNATLDPHCLWEHLERSPHTAR